MRSSITVCSDDLAPDLAPSSQHWHCVRSLGAMRDILEQAVSSEPTYLDLVGHGTRGARLLRIGTTAIDMADVRVERYFANLAPTLARLNVVGVRLLGCETAVEVVGQRTMRSLARTLALPVYGSRKMLGRSHYQDSGFDPTFASVLIESAQLPTPPHRLA